MVRRVVLTVGVDVEDVNAIVRRVVLTVGVDVEDAEDVDMVVRRVVLTVRDRRRRRSCLACRSLDQRKGDAGSVSVQSAYAVAQLLTVAVERSSSATKVAGETGTSRLSNQESALVYDDRKGSD